jgi:methionyl aminopeptidase
MSHIIIKTPSEIQAMRESGQYLTEILQILRDAAQSWVSLLELDQIAELYCKKHNIKASFRGHQWFPNHVCLSLGDCLVHGIPDATVLKDGDFLKIDMGITHKGMISDAAVSVVIGWDHTNPLAQDLSLITKQALDRGIVLLWPWVSVYDWGKQIEQYMSQHHYSVIHSLCGHGVGRKLREPPFIYNYADQEGKKTKFRPGMIVALEPITAVTSTDYRTKGKNTWNLYTTDGDLGCQREYTLLITENGCEVLAGVQ